jgi:hypothetical protein
LNVASWLLVPGDNADVPCATSARPASSKQTMVAG